jgi:hypothetical protein
MGYCEKRKSVVADTVCGWYGVCWLRTGLKDFIQVNLAAVFGSVSDSGGNHAGSDDRKYLTLEKVTWLTCWFWWLKRFTLQLELFTRINTTEFYGISNVALGIGETIR